MRPSIIVLVLASLSTGALAAPATVRLLQAPAWLERNGAREPLRRGMQLASGDRVATGARARVILSLEEGSLVKLGEQADLELARLSPPAHESGVFEGFLDVVKGAFRFTTTLASRRRAIDARVRSATIGIRGTDVWGKAEDARDFVVLLEGRVSIERGGETVEMDTPLSLYMAPRDAPAEAIRPVDTDDLAVWAQETEPQRGAGVISGDGRYRVNLASFERRAQAEAFAARLGSAGYAVDVEQVDVDSRVWWRAFIAGVASGDDARAVMESLRAPFGLTSPWLSVER